MTSFYNITRQQCGRNVHDVIFLYCVRAIQTLIYTLNIDKIEIINYRQKCHLQRNNSWLTQIPGLTISLTTWDTKVKLLLLFARKLELLHSYFQSN